MKFLLLLLLLPLSLSAATWSKDGATWNFDTGTLRGNLGANHKSFGLAVTHAETGKPLSRSMGWFGLYRVFADGKRLGDGAWDWPSTTALVSNDTLRVLCAPDADNGRFFTLTADYRWAAPTTLDLTVTISPIRELPGFEVFLASYFDATFTNAAVCVATGAAPATLLRATRSLGEWLMFPRDAQAETLARDGRWQILPNAVPWAMPARLAMPAAARWQTGSLTALVMAPAADCFAVALPHETESHCSLYLSLFGRTLKPGVPAHARARLLLQPNTPAPALLPTARAYTGQ